MLLERLQSQTGLSLEQIMTFASTASKRYKVFRIPKRTFGERIIEQPSREIKAIQRWLIFSFLKYFPVHSHAMAYVEGAKIRTNALLHANSAFTIRIDFSDFFPSFHSTHVQNFLETRRPSIDLSLNPDDVFFVRQIVCRNDRLTIGAPSSPSLTNSMMFDFDAAIFSWCQHRRIIYSRYADDIFISSKEPNVLHAAFHHVYDTANSYKFANLKINEKKTAFLSRRYHRSITGLTITPTGDVSIGLEQKKRVKAEIYKRQKIGGNIQEGTWLSGMLAFIKDVEPNFYQTLSRKYIKTMSTYANRSGNKVGSGNRAQLIAKE